MDEQDLALALLTHLEGEALDFAQNLPEYEDYEELVEMLRENFSN